MPCRVYSVKPVIKKHEYIDILFFKGMNATGDVFIESDFQTSILILERVFPSPTHLLHVLCLIKII